MIKILEYKDKSDFNKLALHPLQSWEWGEFRLKTGIKVVRIGRFTNNKLAETAQITIHPIPFTSGNIGYLPKGGIPSKEMIEKLIDLGKQKKCIFIKLEPNIKKDFGFRISDFGFNLVPSPHPLFTKYTFQLDLTKTEEELQKNMHPKTRYNIRLAQKRGVVVKEDNSQKAFNNYLKLMLETTKRQKFYAHDEKYHRLMWETLKTKNLELRTKNSGNKLSAHLLTASYQGKILVTWILFLFNNILYYPYGASSTEHKEIMASNLMMWEAIRFGKKHGAKIFDMWGSLGPNPSPEDPWYGFHRFKQGYNPQLVEFVGSFDLVVNRNLYSIYNVSHKIRELFLKIKSNI